MDHLSTISRPETAASEGYSQHVSPGAGGGGAGGEDCRNYARPNVFLFVNPTSGGNAAGCLMREDGVFELDDLHGRKTKLHVADIRTGESGNKPLFLKLKKVVEDIKREQVEERVTVVMAGGDGTVLWGISEIWAHDIDDSYVIFCTIPFGTGNDFAKALNWNPIHFNDAFGADLPHLRALVTTWNHSRVIVHDIWDIEIKLRINEDNSETTAASTNFAADLLNMEPTSGSAAAAAVKGPCFMQIDSKTRFKKILCDGQGKPLNVLNKKLNNYFSLGIESRIGIGFDRHRKTSALRNKIVYMHEGVKKTLFHKSVIISKLIKNMKTTDPSTGRLQTVFSSNPDNLTQRKLKRCASLIALNIPSFASGLDVWKNAHRNGLIDPVAKGQTTKGDLAVLSQVPQVMGDGKLEWVTFGTITSLGTEQVLEGLGRRLHQGAGPFILNFDEALTPDDRVYFQIDGEFYIMLMPQQMIIHHYRKILCLANGGIRAGQMLDASLISAHYKNTSSSDSVLSQS